MKYLLSLGLVLFSLVACGPSADSFESFTAADPYQVTCAAGYVRVLPHFCQLQADATSNQFNMTNDNTCRSTNISAITNPPAAGAKAVLVSLFWQVNANNAIAFRQININLYLESSCTNNYWAGVMGVREFAAVVAGTILHDGVNSGVIMPINGTSLWYKNSDGATGSTPSAGGRVQGYYD